MKNRWLTYFSELPKGFRVNDGKLKGDTEGKLRIEEKYKMAEEIENLCKALFVGNFPVIIEDETEATRGRLIMIDTEGENWRESEGRELSYHLTLLREEKGVILQFLVDSYRELVSRGLRVPAEYRGLSEANREKTTLITESHASYFETRFYKSPTSRLTTADIAPDYEHWCLSQGYERPNRREMDYLWKALDRLGVEKKKINGIMTRVGYDLVRNKKAKDELDTKVEEFNSSYSGGI